MYWSGNQFFQGAEESFKMAYMKEIVTWRIRSE